jgi:hypothetical protein
LTAMLLRSTLDWRRSMPRISHNTVTVSERRGVRRPPTLRGCR